MRRVRFQVSAELLRQALDMPADAEIVWVGEWSHPSQFTVIAESPDLPEVAESELIPLVTPTVTQTQRTWDWGIE